MRLTASADPARWIPVTDSLGFTGRRHRKAALRMLLGQANQLLGREQPGSRVGAWMMSQAAPLMIKRFDGRLLAWTWQAEPDLIAAMATVQELTPQVRIARASRPIEYDDTERFATPLGVGEKLVMITPPNENASPFASYTWDTGTHLVALHAVCADKERFGTLIPALDDLARSLRIVGDLPAGESGDVLRIDPA